MMFKSFIGSMVLVIMWMVLWMADDVSQIKHLLQKNVAACQVVGHG